MAPTTRANRRSTKPNEEETQFRKDADIESTDVIEELLDNMLDRDNSGDLVDDSDASAIHQRMIELPSEQDPKETYLVFPPATSWGDRDWPKICMGNGAPEPRWRVCRVETEPSHSTIDLSPELVRTATGKWDLNGVRPCNNAAFDAQTHNPSQAYDQNVGLGGLCWKFDEGKESDWKGLNRDQLHEYAFRCLQESSLRPICRAQIEEDILCSPLCELVTNTAPAIPPLPKTPKEGNFVDLENNAVEQSNAQGGLWNFGGRVYNRNHPAFRRRAKGKTLNHRDRVYKRDRTALCRHAKGKTLDQWSKEMFELREDLIQDSKAPGEGQDTSSESEKEATPLAQRSSGGNRAEDSVDIDYPTEKGVTTVDGRERKLSIVGYYSFQAEPRKAAKEATKKIWKQRASNNDQPATLASDADKMHVPAHLYDLLDRNPHNGTLYYEACKKICDDPAERQKLFPVATAVRRIRPWAGSKAPEDVEKKVKSQLPRSCSGKRPFGSTDAPDDEVKSRNAKSSRTETKTSAVSGRKNQSEKPQARDDQSR